MSEPDRDILIRVDENLKNMRSELLGDGQRKGAIPEIKEWQDQHDTKDDERFGKVFGQQNYWKGALAFGAFLFVSLLTLFGIVLEHIYGTAGK